MEEKGRKSSGIFFFFVVERHLCYSTFQQSPFSWVTIQVQLSVFVMIWVTGITLMSTEKPAKDQTGSKKARKHWQQDRSMSHNQNSLY